MMNATTELIFVFLGSGSFASFFQFSLSIHLHPEQDMSYPLQKALELSRQYQELVGTQHSLLGKNEKNSLSAVFVVADHPDCIREMIDWYSNFHKGRIIQKPGILHYRVLFIIDGPDQQVWYDDVERIVEKISATYLPD